MYFRGFKKPGWIWLLEHPNSYANIAERGAEGIREHQDLGL
jgi:hypothetical protein